MELTAYYDAQRALIGAALIAPEIVCELVQEVREDDFSVPELRTLFSSLRSLFLSGRPVDPIVLVGEVGEAYRETVRTAINLTPTAATWRAYAKVLRESAALRAMQDIGAQLAGAVDAADARRMLASAEPLMLDRPGIKTQQIGELLADFLRRMEDKTPPNYLKWGIRQLDEGTGTYNIKGALEAALEVSRQHVRLLHMIQTARYAVNTLCFWAVAVLLFMQARMWIQGGI